MKIFEKEQMLREEGREEERKNTERERARAEQERKNMERERVRAEQERKRADMAEEENRKLREEIERLKRA